MDRYFHKLFAVIIALATAGAQVVCACPTPVLHQAPPVVTRVCSGEKECCRKLQASKPVEPAKQKPCNQCNLKHRTEQAMPDQAAGSTVPQLTLCAILPPVAAQMLGDVFVQPRLIESLPQPPLLKDLFHVHSLLLN